MKQNPLPLNELKIGQIYEVDWRDPSRTGSITMMNIPDYSGEMLPYTIPHNAMILYLDHYTSSFCTWYKVVWLDVVGWFTIASLHTSEKQANLDGNKGES